MVKIVTYPGIYQKGGAYRKRIKYNDRKLLAGK